MDAVVHQKSKASKKKPLPPEQQALEEALACPEDASGTPIKIKVSSQSFKDLVFGIRTTTKMAKVMQAFCQRSNLQIHTVRFLFDGARVNEGSTPATLGMEDGDVIDVMVSMEGGGDNPKKRVREDAVEDLDTLKTDEEKKIGWPNLRRAFGKEMDPASRQNLREAALAVEHRVLVAQSIVKRTEMDFFCSAEHSHRSALEIAKMIQTELLHHDTKHTTFEVTQPLIEIDTALTRISKASLFAE